MDIWVLFPSCNLVRAKRCANLWQTKGYKVGVFLDKGASIKADLVVTGEYKGYYNAINHLCSVIPSKPDIVVAIGDDMEPDKQKPQEIAKLFYEKFPDGFGVMQPMGDELQKDKKLAGSPWIGRGWIERAYGGGGPCPDYYTHFYGDQELWEVADKMGVLWANESLTHYHHHWARKGGPTKTDYQEEHSKTHWEKDNATFIHRQAAGFPGSGMEEPETANVSKQRNIMLQYCNVWWRGGTALFSLDIARAFPQFHHVICYRHDGGVNEEMVQQAKLMGVDLYYLPQLTPATFKELNPFITILHNPGAESLSGVYPYKWIKNYPVITFHHSSVKPWFATDAHVFVSEYLKSRYESLLDRMKRWDVIPPCIDTSAYKSSQDDLVRFAVVLSTDRKKFSVKMLDTVRNYVTQKHLHTRLHIIGGTGFYKCAHPRIHVEDFTDNMASSLVKMDCLVYYAEIPDTWGRVVTEALASGSYVIARNFGAMPEQLSKTYSGALVTSLDEVHDAMEKVVGMRQSGSRWQDEAMRVAGKLAGYPILKDKLGTLIDSVALGGV
jgi:glycosyltransferase involved in cell wall biosynthesis